MGKDDNTGSAGKKLFWSRPDANYGKSVKFGEQMPGNLDSQTLAYLKKRGWVSESMPPSFNAAKDGELKVVKKRNDELESENDALKRKIDKLISENIEAKKLKAKADNYEELVANNAELTERVSELEAEIEDFPANVREANKVIKKLKNEIEQLTAPGDQK